MRRELLVGGIAVAGLLAVGGYLVRTQRPPVGTTGFVAVKTTFPLPANDVYLLGTTSLDTLSRQVPGEATFAEKVGPTRLQVRRAGQTHDLCELTVRPNRITTVSLVNVNNRIGCRIEA